MRATSIITITGPGGVINFEYYVILKALRDAGISVTEDNESAYAEAVDAEEHVCAVSDRLTSGDIKNWCVRLEARHLPWGG